MNGRRSRRGTEPAEESCQRAQVGDTAYKDAQESSQRSRRHGRRFGTAGPFSATDSSIRMQAGPVFVSASSHICPCRRRIPANDAPSSHMVPPWWRGVRDGAAVHGTTVKPLRTHSVLILKEVFSAPRTLVNCVVKASRGAPLPSLVVAVHVEVAVGRGHRAACVVSRRLRRPHLLLPRFPGVQQTLQVGDLLPEQL